MTVKDKKIQDQQMLIDKLRKQIEMLTAENKSLQIRLTSITEKADEQYKACMQERDMLLAKIAELKGKQC